MGLSDLSSYLQSHKSVVFESLCPQESFFQDIDLLQNHGIVSIAGLFISIFCVYSHAVHHSVNIRQM